MATKTFVLSAGAILTSENSLLRFGDDNRIVIPLCILDKIRAYKGKYEKERIAVKILEYLDSLPFEKYDISKGAKQSNGSTLVISHNFKDIRIQEMEALNEYDLRTLQTCKGLIQEGFDKVTLISKNPLLRMKAQIIGIEAQNFRDELFPTIAEQYKGRRTIEVAETIINQMYKDGKIKPSDICTTEQLDDLTANEFIQMQCGKTQFLGRYDACSGEIVALTYNNSTNNNLISNVMAKNVGQKFIMEALSKPAQEAPLIVIKGTAGTGKTFCALGVGLEKQEQGEYSRVLISTPGETIGGQQIGFLPGDIDDKLTPFLGGIFTNLEILLNYQDGKKKQKGEQYENGRYYLEKGIIRIQALGMLRGQSIVNTYFIIDETQNIDPADIKSILTRAAEGSKFIFLGDPTQIDNPKLNERYNGLVYVSETMKGDPLCWQITMDGDNESVRSDLARSAVKRLCK